MTTCIILQVHFFPLKPAHCWEECLPKGYPLRYVAKFRKHLNRMLIQPENEYSNTILILVLYIVFCSS